MWLLSNIFSQFHPPAIFYRILLVYLSYLTAFLQPLCRLPCHVGFIASSIVICTCSACHCRLFFYRLSLFHCVTVSLIPSLGLSQFFAQECMRAAQREVEHVHFVFNLNVAELWFCLHRSPEYVLPLIIVFAFLCTPYFVNTQCKR